MEGKMEVKTVVMVGMFAAVLAAAAQISVPLPFGVSLTLQTFAVALSGMILGSRKGTLAVLIYILTGLAGMPVFSNFRGGPGVLFGKSGGFLFGFLFMAFLCGTAMKLKNKAGMVLLFAAGLAVCHICGILQFAVISHMSFIESAALVSVPFLIKDIVSAAIAYGAAGIIRRSIHAAGIR